MDLGLLFLNSPVIDFLNLHAGLRFEQFNRIDRSIQHFRDFLSFARMPFGLPATEVMMPMAMSTFPSLSWLAKTPETALKGIRKISDHQQSWGYEDGPWKEPGPSLLVAADF